MTHQEFQCHVKIIPAGLQIRIKAVVKIQHELAFGNLTDDGEPVEDYGMVFLGE
jgi:hypothetical protein